MEPDAVRGLHSCFPKAALLGLWKFGAGAATPRVVIDLWLASIICEAILPLSAGRWPLGLQSR